MPGPTWLGRAGLNMMPVSVSCVYLAPAELTLYLLLRHMNRGPTAFWCPDVIPAIVTMMPGIIMRAAFLGIDDRRLQFSSVSAAEGVKWAKLINGLVEEIKSKGPFKAYQMLTR
jgi:hypothetical protein